MCLLSYENKEGLYMAGIMTLLLYAVIVGVIAVIAYYVIKKAIKDAVTELKEEKKL